MLTIKFFQVNGNYYAKARMGGNVVDTTCFYGNTMNVADYIKMIMQWGYSRSEIVFTIDPTCGEYETQDIQHMIEVYAD